MCGFPLHSVYSRAEPEATADGGWQSRSGMAKVGPVSTHQGCERLNVTKVLKERLGTGRNFWHCCGDFDLNPEHNLRGMNPGT